MPIHKLSVWDSNKQIYKYLFQELDLDSENGSRIFSIFDYDLIKHTNLDNFFFEIENNYKIQYQQIIKLYQIHYKTIQSKLKNNKMTNLQLITLDLLNNNLLTADEFHDLVLKIKIKIKPGDIIDLKNNSGLGYYLVYENSHNTQQGSILYVNKTRDILGTNLPHQGWEFVEKYGWNGYIKKLNENNDFPVRINGCYLPWNCGIESARYGFTVFCHDEKEKPKIKINGKEYSGKLIEFGPP